MTAAPPPPDRHDAPVDRLSLGTSGDMEAVEANLMTRAPTGTVIADHPVEAPDRPDRRVATTGRRVMLALTGLAVLASIWATGIGREQIVNPGGWEQFSRFFEAALQPELDPAFLRLTWDAALVTLAYAVLGTALAVMIGLAGGILATTAWSDSASPGGVGRAGRAVVRIVAVPLRAVHEAVWAVILVTILGLDPLVAILAIGVPFGAVTTKVYADILDEIPRGPFLALRASGASRPAAFLYGVLPAALRSLTSYGFYRFECGIRAAAVLGVIGAGGLGFQLRLSFQSLNYNEMWTLIGALVVLAAAADAWGSALRRREGRRSGRRWAVVASLAGTAVALVLAWRELGVDPSTLWSTRTRVNAERFVSEAWPPSFDGGTGELFTLSAQTLAMSILAIVAAFTGAFLIAFAAARPRRRSGGRAPGVARSRIRAAALRFLLLFTRAVPPPVWALVLVFVVFPGVLPGAIALAVYNFGVLGRLMAEMAEQQDDRSSQVLRASGLSSTKVVVYDRAPRLSTPFLAYGLYRWEVTIRETVVVGLVAAGGLGFALNQELAAFDYPAVTAIVLALIAITFLVDIISMVARRTLR